MATSKKLHELVWEKGAVIPNYNKNIWRRDYKRNAIQFSKYGDRSSKYGWEIDHIKPKAQGGGDNLSNLRPLQWEANVARNG